MLERRFSALNLLLLNINGMVGSAWLFAPLYAAQMAGSSAIIAWILGGIATICVALTFAELSTLLPQAGGSLRIPQISHGEFAGFIMCWISWLSCVTMPPIEVLAVLQYASAYFPALTHKINNTHVLTLLGYTWATATMLFLSFINIASFRGLVRVNQLLFSFKILVMVFTAIFLVKTSFHASNFFALGGEKIVLNWHDIFTAIASGGIAFAFTGFKHSVEMAGEVKNSNFSIPLAIVGSVVICLLLYLLLQVAFIGALPSNLLQHGWHTLAFTGDAGPFVGLAGILGLMLLVKFLYVDAAVSPLGAGLIYLTSTSRVIYALSKSGYVPPVFSNLNKKGFPVWAVFFNFAVGMLLFMPFPAWQNMVAFLVSAVVISYAMGPVALLCLRKIIPDGDRPFRLQISYILCLIAFYFCNLMCYWTGWETIYKLAIALVIGMVLFGFAFIRHKKTYHGAGLKAAFWIGPYLLGLVLISYFGSFGGNNTINFGWDFLVIGVFSVIMLHLAIAMRREYLQGDELVSSNEL
ncbi:MAG: APC family permease [Gammaproteobacteria bacterium]